MVVNVAFQFIKQLTIIFELKTELSLLTSIPKRVINRHHHPSTYKATNKIKHFNW